VLAIDKNQSALNIKNRMSVTKLIYISYTQYWT